MKPTNDDAIDALLIEYALDQLEPDEKARIELMLAERPELMREARALRRMVARMGVSMIMPAPRLVSRTRHAAREARARAGTFRGLLASALRRPVTAAAAGAIAVALVVALVGPSLWRPGPEPVPRPIVSEAIAPQPEAIPEFLERSLGQVRSLARGTDSARELLKGIDDFSQVGAQAMLLAEKPECTEAQRAVLEDVAAVWRTGYERVNSAGRLTDEIIEEMRELVADKHLVQQLEALVRP